MNQKTREYLHYLTTLSLTAGFGATLLAAETMFSDADASVPEIGQVQEEYVPPWYYQAWPESTFHRINAAQNSEHDRGMHDFDFAGLFEQIDKA